MSLVIRTAGPDGMATMASWAAEEGWNPGRSDILAFHASDPDGFLMAEQAGESVGCISAVRQGDRFGFIGFYIVRPAWRGRGIGMALWQAAMARLRGRVIGLDGVVAQQANYGRSGFCTAWRNIRYAAEMPRRAGGGIGQVVPVASQPFQAILDLDAAVLPTARPAFLRSWIDLPGHRALAVLREGKLAGFGTARPSETGTRIGPLTAIDAAAARALFDALIEGAAGPVFLDLPEPNDAARALAEAAGMAPVFETARMYAGQPPAIRLDQAFGLASFELG
jgi:ribosomal protein S18 acetylase RimI-like enzyme